MKIFGYEFNKQKPIIQESKPVHTDTINPMDVFNFALQNEYVPPTGSYYSQNGMIRWGQNNLFPNQLSDLYLSSPIHASIINQKCNLIAGSDIGFSNLSGLTDTQKNELNRFAVAANGCDKSIYEVGKELILDYQVFGQFALEIIWDLTFTKIIKINRIPVMCIRIGEENTFGRIEKFYFNKDWTRPHLNGTKELVPFDVNDKTNTNQILFIKNNTLDGRYYGVPKYSSGLNWIASDAAISKFHLSNITNGMSPSLKIQFFKVPETQIQRDEIVQNIKRQYTGQGNAGKAMILFSDGKDTAPEIEPIQVNNIDKQFTVIADQIVEQILRAHNGVSGILFGISTSGNKLSLQGEYEAAFKIFSETVIAPDRKIIEDTLNKVLQINGLNAGLFFQPFQLYNNQMG